MDKIAKSKKNSGDSSEKNPLILTEEEIQVDESSSLSLIAKEFKAGFDFIKKHDKSVTIFGSARLPQDSKACLEAKAIAKRIVSELGYAIVTGGGGGVMEAANHGAAEAGGQSVGMGIKLPREQKFNPYINSKISFDYFFVRKTMLTFAAEAFLFFPGGFGTLDEFFDIMTLSQTAKIPRVPLILVGRDYWQSLEHFIQEKLLKNYKTIDAEDGMLYRIIDDHDQIIGAVKQSPRRNWWKDFEIVK